MSKRTLAVAKPDAPWKADIWVGESDRWPRGLRLTNHVLKLISGVLADFADASNVLR